MEDWQRIKKEFLEIWTFEKVKNMTLEEYTNLEKNNSFTYWMESKTNNVLGIGGGSSYKFGIFKRNNKYEKQDNLKKGQGGDDEYGWYTKYGNDRNEVFEKVKSLIIEIIESSQNKEFSEIDDIASGTAYKWKIAFMYAPDKTLLRIASNKAFLFLAEKYDINSTSISEIQKELIEIKPREMKFYDYSSKLWTEFEMRETNKKINYEKEFSKWNLRTATKKGGEVTEDRNLAMIEKLKTGIPKLIKEDISLFNTDNIKFLKEIKNRFSSNGNLNSFLKGNNNANCSSSLHRYIKFLEENKDYEVNKKEESVSNKEIGNLTFPHKNILLKGVPGTGKSRAIENIINKKLGLEEHKENVLRVNIHSASSNADLMQGIGISSKDGQIEYKEKQGLILNLIQRATFTPNQPFVLVLEEIQENSLNELIGDLIYLIEESKRAENLVADDEEYSYEVLVEKIIADNPQTDYVEIPYLVNESTAYRKMIMPHNLYIFCTSNYRDDKKVIEDNLLRRFEVLEIYPKVDVVSEYYREFFSQLNENILEVMKDEIHPDRFLIGHSNWIDVKTDEAFYRAFLKVVVEFKDIKEVEFSDFKEIVEKLPLVEELNFNSYKDLIEDLQSKAGYDFLD